MMPTTNEINSFKERIKCKSEIFNKLIISINNWQEKLNKKIDKLKENLKNEITVLEKTFLNYNQNYMNYTYYQNFIKFNKEMNIFNNKYLKEFYENIRFEEQTRSIIEVICNPNYESKTKKNGILLEDKDLNNCLLSKINNNIFFGFFGNNKACLFKFNNESCKLDIINNSIISFNESIYSISNSKKNQKIYACLCYKKLVKVFKYNIDNNSLKICNEEIKQNSLDKFYKCIPLFNDYVATSDKEEICIWEKRHNRVSYAFINKIIVGHKIFDIILYESKLFIFSIKNEIGFSKIFPNVDLDKSVKKIDVIDSMNGLILNKDYVFANCKEGIAMISVKTKELVQYISIDSNNKILCKISEDNLCMVILNDYHYISTTKLKYYEGCLIKTGEIRVKKDDKIGANNINNTIHIYLIDGMKVIILGYYTYMILDPN